MKRGIKILHWLAFAYLVYLFGYASLFKVFQKPSMVEGMEMFGFGKTWTLVIGTGELLGVIGLITGIWFHQVKNIATLWLLPFTIGALMVHISHGDYVHYYDALTGGIAGVVLLATDRNFKIIL